MTTEAVPVAIKHLDFDPEDKTEEKSEEAKKCRIPIGTHPHTKEATRCGLPATHFLRWSIKCCPNLRTYACEKCFKQIMSGSSALKLICSNHKNDFNTLKDLVEIKPL